MAPSPPERHNRIRHHWHFVTRSATTVTRTDSLIELDGVLLFRRIIWYCTQEKYLRFSSKNGGLQNLTTSRTIWIIRNCWMTRYSLPIDNDTNTAFAALVSLVWSFHSVFEVSNANLMVTAKEWNDYTKKGRCNISMPATVALSCKKHCPRDVRTSTYPPRSNSWNLQYPI